MSDRLPTPGSGPLFLGDGGLETTMIFDEGFELPCFASFLLLREPRGVDALRRYYRDYIEIARRHGCGFTLDTPTWRANADWGAKLGYTPEALAGVNRDAVAVADEIRAGAETAETPIAVCGTIGPRGDAYHPSTTMSSEEAERYHAVQIETFARTAVDMVSAYTLAYAEEAIGIVNAAAAAGVPVSISFTVDTDGTLLSGQPVGGAIEQVDAQTNGAARFFMINCAHPTHVAPAIEHDAPWRERLCGIRPNASRKSHDELDRAPALDRGDPAELAAAFAALKPSLPGLRVLGGCCGTGPSHVAWICDAWLS